MKTTINTKELVSAVAIAANYTSKNGDNANKALFSYEDETTFSIKSTDYIEAINIKLNCKGLEFFEDFSLDIKTFLAIVKIAKKEETILEKTDDKLLVKSGRTRAKIELLSEVPILKEDTDKITDFVLTTEIINSFKIMEHSIDSGFSGRLELTGMLMKCENGLLTFAGTDSKRLCIEKHECVASDFEKIIPKTALKTLTRCSAGTIINISDNDIYVENKKQKYFCKFINSTYVAFEKIIPVSHTQTFKINTKLFQEILKDTSIMDENVLIEIKNGKIKSSSLEGNIETERDLETGNADIEFAVCAKYALDYLAVCKYNEIQIGFNDSLLPFCLIKAPSEFEIIMPLNTNA